MIKIWNKYAAILFIISFYFLMTIQSFLPFVEIKKLKGDIIMESNTTFSWKDWWSETYQKQKSDFLNENFGFRELLVRIHNQIYFSFFNRAFANDVVIGKNNYLFEKNYLRATTGQDLLSDQIIKAKVDTFLKVQNELKINGTELLLVLAPGKATFYPEFIPDEYGKPATITNYTKFKNAFSASGLPFIDCNDWFKSMKANSKYLLYPKSGIHWSQYGVSLFVDSLSKYIESNYHVKLPSRKLIDLKISQREENVEKDVDHDVEDGMNLLFNLSTPKMAYPQYDYTDSTPKTFSVVTIADSYFWQIFSSGAAEHLFKDPAFYYYFLRAYYINSPEKEMNAISVKEEIKKYNLVLFMITDGNLPKFDFGFSKEYLYSHRLNDIEFEKAVLLKRKYIKASPKWFSIIQDKAAQANKPLESILREDAEWSVREEIRNK